MNYRIDKELSVVLCRPDGDFSFEELFQHLQQLITDPDFFAGISGLYDFTNVLHVDGDLTALLSTAETINDKQVLPKVSKVAIILPDDNENMQRIFEGYRLMVTDAQVKYALFEHRNYQQALEFINLSTKPVF